jgi:hypothetical protein
MPRRIQLRRSRGWRKPANTVVVARPTRWGNPWRIGEPHPDPAEHGRPITDRADAVGAYRNGMNHGLLAVDDTMIRAEHAGKDLACWCPPTPASDRQPSCHGDLLLQIANPTTEPGEQRSGQAASGSLRRHTPITYESSTGDPGGRHRYWARSFAGWRQMPPAPGPNGGPDELLIVD